MKKNLIIRNFRPIDAKTVSHLDKLYSRKNYYRPSQLLKYYRKNKELFLVAEINKKIIGFIIGKRKRKKTGIIEMLFVHPKHRNKRIGTKLAKKLITKFKKIGVKSIFLVNPIKDKKAHILYKYLGFKTTAYHMKKKLKVKKK